MFRIAGTLILAFLAGIVGGACNCDHRVPFESAPSNQRAASTTQGSQERAPAPFEPTHGTSFPELTRRVAVEGAPIEVASGSIRALLPVDVEADGDRDALLVITSQEGAPALAVARRNGATFAPMATITTDQGTSCRLKNATMSSLSPRYAIASLERTCDAAPGTVEGVWIIALGENPRMIERVAVLPAYGRAEGRIRIEASARDHDQDGHEDVVLTAAVQPRDSNTIARVALPWVDRASGLARDTREPETTVRTLANEARDALRADMDGAIEKARQALLVHDAFCRESSIARVQVGDAEGVACGASEGAGIAAAALARALARKGDAWGATRAVSLLSKVGYSIAQPAREEAERAVASIPATRGLTWREIARMDPPRAPPVRLSALGFIDARTLVLRGTPSRRIDVQATLAITPGSTDAVHAHDVQANPADASVLVRDPSERFAVVDLGRTCEGTVLVIVPASAVVAGVVAAQAHARPLLAGRFVAGACSPSAATSTAAAGDFSVLGWAPQGIIAAKGEEVRVVPLTSEAQVAGEPSILSSETPLPAPVAVGAATADGRAYALPTRFGVFLRTFDTGPRTIFLRPEGWDSAEGIATDVAVSPDTRRIAVLKGTRVWLIERQSAQD